MTGSPRPGRNPESRRILLTWLGISLVLSFLPPGIWGLAALLVLPGAGIAAWLPPRSGRVLWIASSLILGFVVAGLLATALEFLHLQSAWRWVLAAWNVLSVGAVLARDRIAARQEVVASEGALPATAGDAAAALRNAGLIGLGLALLVILPPLVRPWIAQRADSWFHAAVISEIGRAGLPPQDPYFAGFRLQYMWFYHMLVTGFAWSTGLSPFVIMPIVNAVSIVGLCVLSADVLLALGAGRRAAVWAAALVPLALDALFWVFFPIRVLRGMTGTVSGPAEIVRSFSLKPLDILTTRAFLSELGAFPFFLNKFLTGTAYGLALAFLLLYLAALVRFAASGRRAFLVSAGVMLFAMLLLHPVVGLTALGVSGLVGVAAWLIGRKGVGLSFGRVLAWGIAAALAALAAFPYLQSVMSGKPGDQLLPFAFDIRVVVSLIAACLFVILAAIGPLRKLWRDATPGGRLFVLWTLATMVFASVIRLPGPNVIDKFTNVVYLPLALAAAIWAARAWQGRRGLLIAVLVLVPANLIGYAGYWGDPDQRERSPEAVELYDWLGRETPRDAVILENHERTGALVLGPRRLYFGKAAYAEQWGYDRQEMERRRGVLETIFAPDLEIDAGSVGNLRSLGSPVYVIVRAEDFTSDADFHKLDGYSGWFSPVYERNSVRIYRLTT